MAKPFFDIKAKENECMYCAWWIGFVTGEGESLGHGECRRFPPTQLKEKTKNGFSVPLPIGVPPVTEESHSCGEFTNIPQD